jgi:hypothetical protein
LIEEFWPFLGPFDLPSAPHEIEDAMFDLLEQLGPDGLLEIMKRIGELPRGMERDMREMLEEIGPGGMLEIMRQEAEALPPPKSTAKPGKRNRRSG